MGYQVQLCPWEWHPYILMTCISLESIGILLDLAKPGFLLEMYLFKTEATPGE